jgi:hypothetical protein
VAEPLGTSGAVESDRIGGARGSAARGRGWLRRFRSYSRWQLWLRPVADRMAPQPGHCTAPIPRRMMADSPSSLCRSPKCWYSWELLAPRQRPSCGPNLHTGKGQAMVGARLWLRRCVGCLGVACLLGAAMAEGDGPVSVAAKGCGFGAG